MEGSTEDLGAPESWEVSDLDDSMKRLMLSSKSRKAGDTSADSAAPDSSTTVMSSSSSFSSPSSDKVSVDALNQVDQFLREAIQNPRERLSILRMEQDILKFINDPTQQQLEFQQLPTSYLRLAAHRVARHYSLQSMVPSDNVLPDGSSLSIIISKNSECRLPSIRLADIPVNLPSERNAIVKLAIKQRPQKLSHTAGGANSNSSREGNSKSVEERKEEYNKARARIFNSNNSGSINGSQESDLRQHDQSLLTSLGVSKVEDKSTSTAGMNSRRGLIDSSTNTSRPARSRTDKDPFGRYKQRVAIFRDREVERKDPDYDRSYDRYMQRFDPGFGFNGGSYAMQPMYAPVLNYNTEFPQLGSAHSQIPAEPPAQALPQHLPRPWGAPSPAGIGYGLPESMMTPYNPNHVSPRSSSPMYVHSSQCPSPHPGMPFILPEHLRQPFLQSQQQPDTSFGLARPR